MIAISAGDPALGFPSIFSIINSICTQMIKTCYTTTIYTVLTT